MPINHHFETSHNENKNTRRTCRWIGHSHGNPAGGNDGPILGFAIAGKDGKFQPAKAEWSNPGDRSLVVLSSPLEAEPVYYRHAWGRNPLANLKADGIPFDVLRNDNLTVADMYEIFTGKKSATPNILDGVEFRDLRNALKAEDVKRRLKEAETFIKEHQK